MSRIIWKILVTIFLLVLSFTTRADPFVEATSHRQPFIYQTYFGTHFHRLMLKENQINKYKQTNWQKSQFGAIRLWDSATSWANIAPYPGQWDFRRMDFYIDQAGINNATVMYTLGLTPQWASARPLEKCPYGLGCSAEPANIADWEEYVRTVAQRYKGKIAIYELWNEPKFSEIIQDRGHGVFYTGSLAKMLEMAKVARKVLDEEDPHAKLSTPGFVNGPHRLEMFLQLGGKHYVQTISYHFYAEDSKYMANQLLDIRRVMQQQGVTNLPLLNTETGVEVLKPNSPPSGIAVYSQAEAAGKIAQYLILGAAGGIQQYYQYAWDNERMGMVTPQGEKLPTYDAYVKTRSWLINSKMLGCESITPNGVKCMAEKAGKRFLYVWAVKSGTYNVPLPNGYKVAAIEKLNDTAPQTRASNTSTINLELGDAPIRVMLKAQ